jgi:hypothetical protein
MELLGGTGRREICQSSAMLLNPKLSLSGQFCTSVWSSPLPCTSAVPLEAIKHELRVGENLDENKESGSLGGVTSVV